MIIAMKLDCFDVEMSDAKEGLNIDMLWFGC